MLLEVVFILYIFYFNLYFVFTILTLCIYTRHIHFFIHSYQIQPKNTSSRVSTATTKKSNILCNLQCTISCRNRKSMVCYSEHSLCHFSLTDQFSKEKQQILLTVLVVFKDLQLISFCKNKILSVLYNKYIILPEMLNETLRIIARKFNGSLKCKSTFV